MALSMRQRQAVTKELALSYRKARKKKKGETLTFLTETAGYNRSYAARVLRARAKPRVLGRLKVEEKSLTLVEDERSKRKRKARGKEYGEEVFLALKKIWAISDLICGKRLAPFLPEIVSVLERFGELDIEASVKKKLLEISASTIDRMLAKEKAKFSLKGRSRTKPGTLLRNQVPIRTFSDLDEKKEGFVEIDLVAHDGGDPKGEFIQTLDVTDVASGWTETEAVKNKAQKWVFEALKSISARLPFPLLGIDSDNGSEFINVYLLKFCKENEVSFTRSRPYRKNDNCFVEQKNYSVVRRAVGYARYDTKEELKTLNELYHCLRLYTNFFQPVMKLLSKERIGSQVRKKYDEAKTPYQRLLLSPDLAQQSKKRLKKEYGKLNPAELKRKITKLQARLMKLTALKEQLRREQASKDKDFEYVFDEAMNQPFEYIFT